MSTKPEIKRLAVMASGGGSNLQAVLDAIDAGEINAKVVIVITDRPAYALERAKMSGIPGVCFDRRTYTDQSKFYSDIYDKLSEMRADAIVLAGYLSILDARLVDRYESKILNVHPSLIPSFCGMGFYGSRVHQAVLDYGCKVSGASVHLVDAGADTGPIVLQECVPVLPGDDANALAARVLEKEHLLLPKAVRLLVEDKLVVKGRTVKILE